MLPLLSRCWWVMVLGEYRLWPLALPRLSWQCYSCGPLGPVSSSLCGSSLRAPSFSA